MPVRAFETGTLFRVAPDAARSIKAAPRQSGQSQAPVSVVFSVVALEAFINEVTGLALEGPNTPAVWGLAWFLFSLN